jgi:AraC family transcriptional regulator
VLKSPAWLDYHQGLEYDKLLPSPPLLLSQGHWQGLVLEHHDTPPWEIPESCVSHHHIGVLLGPWHGERWIDGRHRSEMAPKGSLSIIPAGVPFASRWQNRSQAIVLAIDPTLLGRLAHEAVDGDRLRLNFCWLHDGDPFISQILHLLKTDTESVHPLGPIYGDSLGTALAAHLLRHYATRSFTLPAYTGGMPRYRLLPVLEYIDAHLQHPLSLQELAAVANMSQYYFCRMFRQTMGIAPFQYVRQQRIEKARKLLEQPHLSILEVGLQCGFTSPSHFTRQFHQIVGVTPKAYRNAFLP